MSIRSIVFPGRFQPVSEAHVSRMRWAMCKHPEAKLTVVIGETGVLNRQNFLTADERKEIFELLIEGLGMARVQIAVVSGCSDGCLWAGRVLAAVPDADAVLSDNPFVYEPLRAAGLTAIHYTREGVDGCTIRDRPFAEWKCFVPALEWELLKRWEVPKRICLLYNDGGRYPFLEKEKREKGQWTKQMPIVL